MTEIKQIEKILNEADVPKEVWIGTDSIADRVTWLTRRNKLNENSSHQRFDEIQKLETNLQDARAALAAVVEKERTVLDKSISDVRLFLLQEIAKCSSADELLDIALANFTHEEQCVRILATCLFRNEELDEEVDV